MLNLYTAILTINMVCPELGGTFFEKRYVTPVKSQRVLLETLEYLTGKEIDNCEMIDIKLEMKTTSKKK